MQFLQRVRLWPRPLPCPGIFQKRYPPSRSIKSLFQWLNENECRQNSCSKWVTAKIVHITGWQQIPLKQRKPRRCGEAFLFSIYQVSWWSETNTPREFEGCGPRKSGVVVFGLSLNGKLGGIQLSLLCRLAESLNLVSKQTGRPCF
jgi:hypothetical protein